LQIYEEYLKNNSLFIKNLKKLTEVARRKPPIPANKSMKVNLGFSGAGNGKFRNSEFSFYRDRLK